MLLMYSFRFQTERRLSIDTLDIASPVVARHAKNVAAHALPRIQYPNGAVLLKDGQMAEQDN
jgi:hypothetical protein